MKKEKINEFSFRVSQANRSELVVISYDIILEDISEAIEAFEKEKLEEYTELLKHSTRILNEIMGSLDYSKKLSYELIALYKFANKEIVRAMMSREPAALITVQEMLGKLRAAFSEVAKKDNSGTVMRNTQTIAPGVTYGKNAMDNVCINVNSILRGIRA